MSEESLDEKPCVPDGHGFCKSHSTCEQVRDRIAVMIKALEQYANPDYYFFLCDPIGRMTDPTKKAKEALAIVNINAAR